MATPPRIQPFTYLAKAFAYRWNVLLLAGATGFALLSGSPDVWLPLVLAGEVAYLGALSAHPRFQAAVAAEAAKDQRQAGTASSEEMLTKVVRKLPARSLERFEALRARCRELRQLALELKHPGQPAEALPLERLQHAGLDRLLWIYLRLLFTEHSLDRFLKHTSIAQLEADIADLEKRIAQTERVADQIQRQKMQHALEDNLQTSRARLANFNRARDNYQIVQLEIDRLENKIRALSEMTVNRQDPDFITTQVDAVAGSMLQTERTMNDLQFATGLEVADETVPALLQRELPTTS